MGTRGESPAATASPGLKGIACRVGKADVALPVSAVGQIVEYPVFSLPLARKWIAGVGIHDEEPVVSIALTRQANGGAGARSPQQRIARGILLETEGLSTGRAANQIRWSLEVDVLGTFVLATLVPRPPPAGLDLPSWITQARIEDGRTVGWIDVAAMLAELTAPEKGD